jgi:hypothetical protein
LTPSEKAVTKKIRELSSNNRAESLIFKLRALEDSLEPNVAAKLAIGLAQNGANFPQGKGLFSSFTAPFPQAAFLVSKLVELLPPGSLRETLAHRVIKEADPIAFAIECFHWLQIDKSHEGVDRILAETVEHELGTILADRIRNAARTTPPYDSSPENSQVLFNVWNEYGKAGEVTNYLRSRFAANAEEVMQFLTSYVGLSWEMETGIAHRSYFRREDYNAIARLIPTEEIMSHLRALYGKELDSPEPHLPRRTALAKRVAHQFAAIHKHVQSTPQESLTQTNPQNS